PADGEGGGEDDRKERAREDEATERGPDPTAGGPGQHVRPRAGGAGDREHHQVPVVAGEDVPHPRHPIEVEGRRLEPRDGAGEEGGGGGGGGAGGGGPTPAAGPPRGGRGPGGGRPP